MLKIKSCSGFECEKQLSTSPEDFFNQSDISYEHQGKERTLNVTYVRYFDQYMQENEIYDAEKTGVPFYHIVALLILMKNEGFVEASRLYFNDTDKFLTSFDSKDIDEAVSIYKKHT